MLNTDREHHDGLILALLVITPIVLAVWIIVAITKSIFQRHAVDRDLKALDAAVARGRLYDVNGFLNQAARFGP
jgi:hypothetical protein